MEPARCAASRPRGATPHPAHGNLQASTAHAATPKVSGSRPPGHPRNGQCIAVRPRPLHRIGAIHEIRHRLRDDAPDDGVDRLSVEPLIQLVAAARRPYPGHPVPIDEAGNKICLMSSQGFGCGAGAASPRGSRPPWDRRCTGIARWCQNASRAGRSLHGVRPGRPRPVWPPPQRPIRQREGVRHRAERPALREHVEDEGEDPLAGRKPATVPHARTIGPAPTTTPGRGIRSRGEGFAPHGRNPNAWPFRLSPPENNGDILWAGHEAPWPG